MIRCLALLAALLVAGCDAAAPVPPLAGTRIGAPFALVDGDGHRVTDRSFAGRYRVMYFGYTYCPDVCPTDMAAIGDAMRRLEASDPALARRIVPIFVTVDPVRDTPPVVKAFAAAFSPRVVPLTGSPQAIAATAKAYAIFVQKGAVQPGGAYLVNHSRQTYLMDPDNKPLALLPSDQGGAAVAAEIRRWVR